MADISKIKLPSGTTYDIKDETARTDIGTINSSITTINSDISSLKNSVTGGMHYLGKTTTQLTDGATTATITIGDKTVTPTSGDIVIYENKLFVYAIIDENGKWNLFGSTGSLKTLAFKDNATGKITPTGTVSTPTFSGTQATISVSGTPSGSITVGNGTANYTPLGTVSATFSGSSMTSTGNYTPSGTIGVGTGTANYTPTGSLTGGLISVSLNTATKYVASSTTGGGSVSNGSAASCTLPTLSTSVSGLVLTIGWSAGSFTANTPTSVTLPTFSSATVASGVKSASITTLPTFSGDGALLKFTGTQGQVSVSGTTKGSITGLGFSGTGTQLKFTGNSLTSSGTYTPAGGVSQPTFTGEEGSVTVS